MALDPAMAHRVQWMLDHPDEAHAYYLAHRPGFWRRVWAWLRESW